MRKLVCACMFLLAMSCADQSIPVEPENLQQTALPPCDLVPEAGPCKAAFKKYYFDKAERKCKEFTWGGCGGVVPFNTLEECKKCENLRD